MKILMVTPWYYPVIGGTERLIENISVKLNEMGTPTDIMTFNVDRTWKPWSITQIRKRKIEKINGVTVIRIPGLTLAPARVVFRTNFVPGKFVNYFDNYDIIHFQNDVDLSFPLFSYSVNKPKILHCHCLNTTYRSYRKNPLHRHLLRKIADLYIVQATFILKLLVDLGIPETKIRIVPNGIDIKRFQPSEEAKIENLLLFVGRLDTEKGLPILLTALKYVKTSTRLVIIGPPSRPWFFKEILNSIKMINEKTIHRVAYLGILKTDEVIEWYQKASILVCASLSELFPMVNLEAMSCATAVIATNVGAIPEVVRDHKNGILVPPNDPVQLAEGIQYLLDHEEIRRRFAEEGRKWVVKNFASEVVIERLRQIYEEMI